jgi:DNA polymerase-3 subunit alpha
MRDLLRKLKPTNIEDIIALNALYRPGPLGSGMIDDFVNRKHGRTKVKYDHEVLEPILKDTYGVILYQEQVMRIAVVMAGFTAGQADGLRKAMGKKIPEEIEKQRGGFLDGAKKKGIDVKIAEKVFQNIVHFGGYGFNKSHAAAYGVTSYRTAFLKANYPLQYFTACINSEIGHSAIGKEEEENKMVSYMQDAESEGFSILPPDIQKSSTRFIIEDGKIRFGLLAIKNVGEGAADSIVKEREANGPYKDWQDFMSRIDLHAVNRKVLESLIKAGAFDGFGESHLSVRAELLAKLDNSMNWANSQKQDLSSGQGFLFEASELANTMDIDVKIEAWNEHTALGYEKEVLGFYLSGHPLAQHRADLLAYSQYRLDHLPPASEDSRSAPLIRVAGMIASAKKLVTKEKKEQYARFKLEDLNGEIEVVVFPKSYNNGLAKFVVTNNFVVVKGRLVARESSVELLAEDVMGLDEARRFLTAYAGPLRLKMSSVGMQEGVLEKVKKIFAEHHGQSPVIFDVLVPGHGEYSVETEYTVKATDKLFKDLEKLLGKDALA